MRQLLSLILFLCIGVITPLQGMPYRLCLMENRVVAFGIGASGSADVASKECCGKCDSTERGKYRKHRSDCCVDIDQQAKSTAPRAMEPLSDLSALELPVTTFLTLEWIKLLRPTVAEWSYPQSQKHPLSILGSDRQAILSIWTV